ncbi:MAG: SiaB family protein kinase [Flavobacteriales bacterium]
MSKYYIEVLSKLGISTLSQEVGIIGLHEVFSYQGKFTTTNSESQLREIERQLDLNKFPRAIKKRVYSLAVEMIQNIVHHGLTCPNDVDSSFAVLSQSDSIHLISQNCIFALDTQKLSLAIDTLNGMSEAELRKYHVELLCDNDFSSKGGAGLGLVTLARKSDGKIDYSIEPINSTTSKLTLHISLITSEADKE